MQGLQIRPITVKCELIEVSGDFFWFGRPTPEPKVTGSKPVEGPLTFRRYNGVSSPVEMNNVEET